MSDYKKAYRLPDESFLLEERRGDEVRGSDQGEWELDWKLLYNDDLSVGYKIYRLWGNGGPSNSEWFTEEDYDDDDFMTESWLKKNGWEIITNADEIHSFIASRPGMKELMS